MSLLGVVSKLAQTYTRKIVEHTKNQNSAHHTKAGSPEEKGGSMKFTQE